jgi:hypothetical protein
MNNKGSSTSELTQGAFRLAISVYYEKIKKALCLVFAALCTALFLQRRSKTKRLSECADSGAHNPLSHCWCSEEHLG